MFYQRERVTQFTTMAGVAPFSVAASGNRLLDLTGTCDNALSAGAGCQAISLAVAGAPSFGMDPSTTLPYTTQWNLTVERELARNTKLELAYVGNKGTHILRYIDANAVPADERLNFSLLNAEQPTPDWRSRLRHHQLRPVERQLQLQLVAGFVPHPDQRH